MTESRHGAPSAGASAGGAPRPARTPASLPAALLTDAVAALAAGRTEADVAGACLPLLLERPGVRGVAVVQRRERAVVVLASAGYDCATMAAGTDLPLEAGLPVTEAVRTGRVVVQGEGPSWVALPLGDGLHAAGALLLSLTAPPPAPADLVRLQRLARVLGHALRRAAGQQTQAGSLAAVTGLLRSGPALGTGVGVEVAVRSLPLAGDAGGDVLACLDDGAGGTWLVAADVCGSGVPAALVAVAVRAAVRGCARLVDGPAALLAAVEAALVDDVGPGCFVTALAVQVDAAGRSARVACAGHPRPLLVHEGRAVPVEVEPGPPVALEGHVLPALTEVVVAVPRGAALLLHTDGLVERRTGSTVSLLDPAVLAARLPADLERAVDLVLQAAGAVGPAHDDVSLLLARPLPG